MGFIYALLDPLIPSSNPSDEFRHLPRYVGLTKNLKSALSRHLMERDNDARRRNPHKDAWLRQLKTKGHDPLQVVIEECVDEFMPAREIHHIARLRAAGYPLTNISDGGNVPPSRAGTTLSDEHKKAIGRVWRGKKRSPESVAKSAASRRGMKRSDESKARMSASAKRRMETDEGKANLQRIHSIDRKGWDKGWAGGGMKHDPSYFQSRAVGALVNYTYGQLCTLVGEDYGFWGSRFPLTC